MVATVLVQRGTLKVGDLVVAGAPVGPGARAAQRSRRSRSTMPGPSMPVEILGLDGVPEPGDVLAVVESEKRAREITEYRQRKRRDQAQVTATGARGTLEDMFSQLRLGGEGELPVVIKSDVHGSLEAITRRPRARSAPTRSRSASCSAASAPSPSRDVTLAAASKAAIMGFNVRANAQAREMAERDGVEIRYYSIIYELLDEMKGLLSGMLEPEVPGEHPRPRRDPRGLQRPQGRQDRRLHGHRRPVQARLRGSACCATTWWSTTARWARCERFKDDVREVKEGFECGMSFENYDDIRQGDVIEAYEVEEVARSL